MLYVPPGVIGGGGCGPSSFGVCGAIVGYRVLEDEGDDDESFLGAT